MRGGIKLLHQRIMTHRRRPDKRVRKGRKEAEGGKKNFPQAVKCRGGCPGAHGPQQRSTRHPEAWRSLCDESCLIRLNTAWLGGQWDLR